jgi:hypothetical protein
MKVIKVLGCIGCWACIICAVIFYDLKAAALVALAVLFEAIIAAELIVETEKECGCAECERIAAYEELLRDMENDGK